MRLRDADMQADRVDSCWLCYERFPLFVETITASATLAKQSTWKLDMCASSFQDLYLLKQCLKMFEERNVSMGLQTPTNTFNFQQRHYRTCFFLLWAVFFKPLRTVLAGSHILDHFVACCHVVARHQIVPDICRWPHRLSWNPPSFRSSEGLISRHRHGCGMMWSSLTVTDCMTHYDTGQSRSKGFSGY